MNVGVGGRLVCGYGRGSADVELVHEAGFWFWFGCAGKAREGVRGGCPCSVSLRFRPIFFLTYWEAAGVEVDGGECTFFLRGEMDVLWRVSGRNGGGACALMRGRGGGGRARRGGFQG